MTVSSRKRTYIILSLLSWYELGNIFMGNTIWLLSEDREEDDWDHSLILVNEKQLDKLADELNVKRLSDVYDHSILAEEYGGRVKPKFVIAEELENVLDSMIRAIRKGSASKLNKDNEIIEELEDCLKKVSSAKSKGLKVRLAIVP